MHQRPGNHQPALHPSRQRTDALIAAIGQIDGRQQRFGALSAVGSPHAKQPAMDIQVFGKAEVVVNIDVLDDQSALPFGRQRLAFDIETAEPRLTA